MSLDNDMQKFSEYVHGQDDRVRRYVCYLAHKHKETIEEAAVRSMGRVWKLMQDGVNHAIITAFRGERDLRTNRNLNISLEANIREFGWGYIPVLGGYGENVRDESGEPTGEWRDVDEESYFVSSTDSKKEFRNRILSLLNDDRYAQESAIVKYEDDPIAVLLYADGHEGILGKWSPGSLSKYYTKMKKGPPGRKFAFEACGDVSRSTLMAVDQLLL